MKNTARNAAPVAPVVRHASDFRPQVNDTRASTTILPSANDSMPTATARPASTPPDGIFRNARVMGMPRKARRTVEQVIESLPTKYDEAAYALARLAALDLKKQKVLRTVSEETLPLIFEQRPDLVSLFQKG